LVGGFNAVERDLRLWLRWHAISADRHSHISTFLNLHIYPFAHFLILTFPHFFACSPPSGRTGRPFSSFAVKRPTFQTFLIKKSISPLTLPGGLKRGVSLEDDMRMGGLRVLESDLPLRSGIRAGIP